MSVDITEQSILDALHQVPAPKPVTLPELLAMPSTERDAILDAQAAGAEYEYRHDPELTGFDAFDEEDLDVDYTDSQPREISLVDYHLKPTGQRLSAISS